MVFCVQYPSIIRSNQLCPSRLLLADTDSEDVLEVNIGTERAPRLVRFARDCDAPAVLPSLLSDLAVFRKQAKSAMDAEDDPWQKSLWDAKQKAYKVCMNSIYGVFGAQKGPLTCMELAASITSIGRQMINTTKRMIQARWDGKDGKPKAKVIYGDSVAEDTPVLVRASPLGVSRTYVCEIGQLAPTFAHESWQESGDKWAVPLGTKAGGPVWVWSDEGWTEIHCIIKHRLPVGKRLVKVTTLGGSASVESTVVVTDDHSLLSYDPASGRISEVSPKEVRLGDRLLHYPFDASMQHDARYLSRSDDCNALARNLGRDCAMNAQKEARPVVRLEMLPDAAGDRPWVYDLSTACGHFGAGTSSLSLHNTDSCMVSSWLNPKSEHDHELAPYQRPSSLCCAGAFL